jgi:endonuclease YncB( thermonuclease family)
MLSEELRLELQRAAAANNSPDDTRKTNVVLDDGDSGNERLNYNGVRAKGFNSPETEHNNGRTDAHPDGKLSKELSERLQKEGAYFKSTGKRGTYGRELAEFKDGSGRDLSTDLVASGMAWADRSRKSAEAEMAGIKNRALGDGKTGNATIDEFAARKSKEYYDPFSKATYDGSSYDRRGTFKKAFARGTDQTKSALGGVINYIGDATGNKEWVADGKRMTRDANVDAKLNPREIEDYTKATKSLDTAFTYLVESVGEMAPGLIFDAIATVATGGIGATQAVARRAGTEAIKAGFKKGLISGPALTGFTQSLGDMENALEARGSEENGFAPIASGLVGAAVNLAPYAVIAGDVLRSAGLGDDVVRSVTKAMDKVEKKSKLSRLGDVGKAGVKAGGTEGITETAQMVIDEVILANASDTGFDLKTQDAIDGAIRAVLGGGAMGAGASGIGNAAGIMSEYNAERAQFDDAGNRKNEDGLLVDENGDPIAETNEYEVDTNPLAQEDEDSITWAVEQEIDENSEIDPWKAWEDVVGHELAPSPFGETEGNQVGGEVEESSRASYGKKDVPNLKTTRFNEIKGILEPNGKRVNLKELKTIIASGTVTDKELAQYLGDDMQSTANSIYGNFDREKNDRLKIRALDITIEKVRDGIVKASDETKALLVKAQDTLTVGDINKALDAVNPLINRLAGKRSVKYDTRAMWQEYTGESTTTKDSAKESSDFTTAGETNKPGDKRFNEAAESGAINRDKNAADIARNNEARESKESDMATDDAEDNVQSVDPLILDRIDNKHERERFILDGIINSDGEDTNTGEESQINGTKRSVTLEHGGTVRIENSARATVTEADGNSYIIKSGTQEVSAGSTVTMRGKNRKNKGKHPVFITHNHSGVTQDKAMVAVSELDEVDKATKLGDIKHLVKEYLPDDMASGLTGDTKLAIIKRMLKNEIYKKGNPTIDVDTPNTDLPPKKENAPKKLGTLTRKTVKEEEAGSKRKRVAADKKLAEDKELSQAELEERKLERTNTRKAKEKKKATEQAETNEGRYADSRAALEATIDAQVEAAIHKLDNPESATDAESRRALSKEKRENAKAAKAEQLEAEKNRKPGKPVIKVTAETIAKRKYKHLVRDLRTIVSAAKSGDLDAQEFLKTFAKYSTDPKAQVVLKQAVKDQAERILTDSLTEGKMYDFNEKAIGDEESGDADGSGLNVTKRAEGFVAIGDEMSPKERLVNEAGFKAQVADLLNQLFTGGILQVSPKTLQIFAYELTKSVGGMKKRAGGKGAENSIHPLNVVAESENAKGGNFTARDSVANGRPTKLLTRRTIDKLNKLVNDGKFDEAKTHLIELGLFAEGYVVGDMPKVAFETSTRRLVRQSGNELHHGTTTMNENIVVSSDNPRDKVVNAQGLVEIGLKKNQINIDDIINDGNGSQESDTHYRKAIFEGLIAGVAALRDMGIDIDWNTIPQETILWKLPDGDKRANKLKEFTLGDARQWEKARAEYVNSKTAEAKSEKAKEHAETIAREEHETNTQQEVNKRFAKWQKTSRTGKDPKAAGSQFLRIRKQVEASLKGDIDTRLAEIEEEFASGKVTRETSKYGDEEGDIYSVDEFSEYEGPKDDYLEGNGRENEGVTGVEAVNQVDVKGFNKPRPIYSTPDVAGGVLSNRIEGQLATDEKDNGLRDSSPKIEGETDSDRDARLDSSDRMKAEGTIRSREGLEGDNVVSDVASAKKVLDELDAYVQDKKQTDKAREALGNESSDAATKNRRDADQDQKKADTVEEPIRPKGTMSKERARLEQELTPEQLESREKAEKILEDALEVAFVESAGAPKFSKGRKLQRERKLIKEVRYKRAAARKGIFRIVEMVHTRINRIHPELGEFARKFLNDKTDQTEYLISRMSKLAGDKDAIQRGHDDLIAGRDTQDAKNYLAFQAEVDAHVSQFDPSHKAKKGVRSHLDIAAIDKDRQGFLKILAEAGIKDGHKILEDAFDGEGIPEWAINPNANKSTYNKLDRLDGVMDALRDGGFLDTDAPRHLTNYINAAATWASWNKHSAIEGDSHANFNRLFSEVHPSNKGEATRLFHGITGKNGISTPPWVRKFNSAVMAFQSATIMWFSAVASIPELAGIYSRGRGTIDGVGSDFAKLLTGRGRDELRKIATDYDIISGEVTEHALQRLMAMDDLTTGRLSQKVTNTVFKMNGQIWLTEINRALATSVAKRFLEHHANSSDPSSKRMLEELGTDSKTVNDYLKSGDITSPAGRNYRDAAHRFVNESVTNPTRGQVPLIASDPRFMILSTLKKFFYGFYDNVHKGLYRNLKASKAEQKQMEAIKAMLITGAIILPLAALAEIIREEIKYPLGRPTDKKKSLTDHLINVVGASGALGPMQMAQNASEMSQYGRNPAVVLAGPMVSFGVDAVNGKLRPSNFMPLVNQLPWMATPVNKTIKNMRGEKE